MPPKLENTTAPLEEREESEEKTSQPRPMEMVQLLVERGITEVPTKFIQPEGKRAGPAVETQIPVIDMSGLDDERRDQVLAEVACACEEWGFFQVINHGVPPALMAELLKVAKEFFAMSPEEKEENVMKPGQTVGYGRLFEAKKSVANWIDRLVLWSYGERQKLAEPCMPLKPERFREVVDAYATAVSELCNRIMEIISLSLGLEAHVIGDRVNAKTLGLRTSFNYYPPCPQPELVLGLIPHADSSIVTVLQQDGEVPGLEIMKDGQWIQVPSLRDAFVVNVGDQLQIMSNAKYKSVMHRARTNPAVGRHSFPNFLLPSMETAIEPLQELLSETNPPMYRPLLHLNAAS